MRRTALAAGGFFLLSLIVYNLNLRCVASLDSRGARLIPLALLTGGTLHLDRLEALFPEGPDYWYTRSASGHLVSGYPVVVPLLATPFFLCAARTFASGAVPPRFVDHLAFLEKVSAATIAALSVAVVWLLLRRVTAERPAVWLTIAYAFGTETWAISSQALWQHGTSELLLAGMMLALLQPTIGAHVIAGLLGALLTFNRPPNALFVAAAIVYVWAARADRRLLLAYLVPCAFVAGLGLAYNLSEFATVVGGYRSHAHADLYASSLSGLLDGTAGLLLSPGRGLLLFAPFFAFLVGLPRAAIAPPLRPLLGAFLPAAGLQWLLYGSFSGWPGGVSYGPRMLTDLTPILVVALVPVVERLRGRLLPAVFALTLAYGVAVQAIGAFCFPMGGSTRTVEVWRLDRIQYLVELRGGLAPIEFRPTFRAPNVIW